MKNGYPHMVLDATVRQVRQIQQEREARLGQIATRREAEAYQRRVRDAIARAFSPRPPTTPLNARVTGEVERPAYRIEKLTFESRPGCLVTANLYVPHGLAEPAPCVLGTCGHSESGKASDLYQEFCQRLARAGFVVLIYDPFSQGERDQYYGLPERETLGWGTRAHNMLGKQLELIGEFFGAWRAWDGIRALDYLLSRPEVDPTRVGLTGNSGGGTMTTWLWAVDDRFTMAAPSCFVTTFAHNLENELPADSEQCPPGVLGAGLDLADFIIAGAPKPVMLLGQNYDFFDRRGLKAAYADVKRFYGTVGAPADSVDLFIGPQGHGYSAHNQEAMVAFFCHHAGMPGRRVGVQAGGTEVASETEVLAPETLFAAPEGQVIVAGATPAHELIAARANEIAARRMPPDSRALLEGLARLLALPDGRPLPYHRVLRPVYGEAPYGGEPEVLARYALETEGHIRAFLWKRMARPAYPFTLDVETEVRLYLPHVASQVDLAEDPLAVSLGAEPPLYALDVRGLGQSLPEEEHGEGSVRGFFQPYGMDYMFHAYGLMLGQSYLGRRVYDVLCTMDLLGSLGAQAIHLCGRGQGAIVAAFAALYGERVVSLTLKNGPASFHEWTQAPLVTWPAANFCRGILDLCDLPDCLRVLRERLGAEGVQVIEPWGPAMGPA